MKLICEQCNIIYKACPTCEGARYYAYRNHFCSKECYELYLKGVVNMRIQYDGKMHGVKEYDFKNGVYIIITTKGDIVINENDEKLQGFMLPTKNFKEVKLLKED